MTQKIPKAPIALIGGSGTLSINFPEDLQASDVKVVADGLKFDTPFGPSPEFKLFTLGTKDRRVLTVKMHGRMAGVPWGESAKRTFWVLKQAGIKKILNEAGVGSVNKLLDPGDLVVVDDYIDQSLRKDIHLTEDYLSIMRQALCPNLRRTLLEVAETDVGLGRVFSRGTYLVTEGRHFESPAEVKAFQQWGADVVGQNLCPEVYLAREIGACYAGIYMVVNYGEGVVKEWEHKVLKDMFYHASMPLGKLVLEALRRSSIETKCGCSELRKPTLLKFN